ncbi:MAG TPA: hypothetical protein VMV53_02650 [Acidimicrobiales bacterium]|nr:hypothetical protein [Acidimicrobiales bacterium]
MIRTKHSLLLIILALLVVMVGVVLSWSYLDGAGPTGADPRTPGALIKIAQRFNNDYAANRDGLVYDRWDGPSRAVISRVRYIRVHELCKTAPGHAIVERATRSTDGYWLVGYSISGVQLLDYWHYVDGHWLFSLVKSNPAAAQLYRLPLDQYMAAVGCR